MAIVCDEFAAVLDRVTAAVVCNLLRRSVTRESGAKAIVATSHEEVAAWLRPDLVITCDFGGAWTGCIPQYDTEVRS